MRLPAGGAWRFAILLLGFDAVQAAILAIDFGQEWTKAALVKPGIPLEIVLTKDSKRKEQSVVGFKKDERSYGTDAAGLAGRFPAETFFGLKDLVGRDADDAVVQQYLSRYPAIKATDSGSPHVLAFERGNGIALVEELVAMQLANMKFNAQLMANEKIDGVVMTVPPFWTERQRRSLTQAASLAGLEVLSLINDGLAVATDYAKSRHFETPQIHVIFDAGGGSTSATVVNFETKQVKDIGRFKKNVTSIEVLGTAADPTLGGEAMTMALYEHFIREFEAKKEPGLSTKLRSNPRALSRLLRESTKVKQVLSANTEATLSVESLHEDVDFRTKISRADFEAMTADMQPRVAKVLSDALAAADLSAEGVESVILHGGAGRVPFVQRSLLDVVREEQLARNVNADEAAVIGAVFRGAGLSGRFRVKEVTITDRSLFPVDVDVAGQGFSNALPSSTPFTTSVNLTLPKKITDSFEVAFRYGKHELLPAGNAGKPLSSVKVEGLEEAVNALKKQYTCTPLPVVAARIDASGYAGIDTPYVYCEGEEKAEGVADKLKGWFGGSGEDDADQAAFDKKDAKKDDKKASSASKKPKIHQVKKDVKATVVSGVEVGTKEKTAFKDAGSRIQSLDKMDADRVARETARNELEGYIYKVADLLETPLWQKAATKGEHTALFVANSKARNFLNSQGDTATVKELRKEKQQLVDYVDLIQEKIREHDRRPEVIEQLQKAISDARIFAKEQRVKAEQFIVDHDKWETQKAKFDADKEAAKAAKAAEPAPEPVVDETDSLDEDDTNATKKTAPVAEEEEDDGPEEPASPFRPTDLEPLEDAIEASERWLQENKAKQDEHPEPYAIVIKTADIQDKTDALERQFVALRGRLAYWQPPASAKNTKAKAADTKRDKAREAEILKKLREQAAKMQAEGKFGGDDDADARSSKVRAAGAAATADADFSTSGFTEEMMADAERYAREAIFAASADADGQVDEAAAVARAEKWAQMMRKEYAKGEANKFADILGDKFKVDDSVLDADQKAAFAKAEKWAKDFQADFALKAKAKVEQQKQDKPKPTATHNVKDEL